MRASGLFSCISRRPALRALFRDSAVSAVASKRPATASGCGGAGPSAASPLLSDALRHRRRRGSLHLAPRRSQRRLTPFFSDLLGENGPRFPPGAGASRLWPPLLAAALAPGDTGGGNARSLGARACRGGVGGGGDLGHRARRLGAAVAGFALSDSGRR